MDGWMGLVLCGYRWLCVICFWFGPSTWSLLLFWVKVVHATLVLTYEKVRTLIGGQNPVGEDEKSITKRNLS